MAPPRKHIIDAEDRPPQDMDIDPSIVMFLVLKARAFDVKVPPVEPDPGSNATDDDDREVLEDYPSDLTETELKDSIDQLSDDAAVDLVAMFWIGRGDFTADDWEEARELATERAETGSVAEYLMGEPSLGDFLEEGLTQIGYAPEDYAPD